MTSAMLPEVIEQYKALQAGRGFVAGLDWSSVTITGRDRQSFLQSFCTNDIKRLTPGESCEAFFLNVKGKIVGHGLVTCRDEELVIIGVPGQSERLMPHFDRYIIREDVQLRDSTGERLFIATKDAVSVDHATAAFSVNVGDQVGRVVEGTRDRFPLAIASLLELGLQQFGPEAVLAARIEAGVPLFGVDFDEHNLPQEVGRDRAAISFTKGCYLGQETVARIDALGHVNHRIVVVRFSGDDVPGVGTELSHNGTAVGSVTSASFSPKYGSPLALAMVRREANGVGTRLESAAGECDVVGY